VAGGFDALRKTRAKSRPANRFGSVRDCTMSVHSTHVFVNEREPTFRPRHWDSGRARGEVLQGSIATDAYVTKKMARVLLSAHEKFISAAISSSHCLSTNKDLEPIVIVDVMLNRTSVLM
jgi:hypothetical protein